MEDSCSEVKDCLFTMKDRLLIYIRQNLHLTSEDIQKEFNIAPNTVSEYLINLEKRNLILRKKVGKIRYIFPTDFSDFFL